MERFQADKPDTGRESTAMELVGPYALLAEIGRGELATVHLAKKHGALGFQRLYALKRLKPGLAGSLEHVELLLDEARLVSGIHHANVADVLDVGTDAGSYVVMEYVEGENLETLLARAGSARHPRYVVPVLVDTLHGLHALHGAVDDAGEPLGVVHQAPRGRHMLVGVDGTARLIDFSQVRARNVRPSRFRSDRLKVAYMAPELALHPDGVDPRADLFVVGIALWEALTGERLFAGDNDGHTFQNLLHRRVPRPSEMGLKPPRCFDAICMRALERDRSKRYGSALEMARDLRDTALNEALYATSAELGQWVRELAGSELRERRRLAGIETPSSGGIPLATPTLGLHRSAVVRGRESAPAAEPGVRHAPPGADDNPYPSDRAPGDSQALASHEGHQYPSDRAPGDSQALASHDEAAVTPPIGMRRPPLPRDGASDEEPTGRRSSLPEALRPTPGLRSPAPGARSDELALAATLPMLAAPSSLALPEVAATAASAPTGDAPGEHDQTQPKVFVPSRPGGRRDPKSVSPGAYSQVDARRGRAGAQAGSTAARRGSFDEAATNTHPASLARTGAPSEGAPAARARPSPVTGSAPSSQLTPLASRRPAVITEAPPKYVQRRDSSPTRMQLPEGPVGVPHRSFPVEDTHANGHRPEGPVGAPHRSFPVEGTHTDGHRPEGPVGAPHRSFPVEDTNSDVHRLGDAPGEPSHSRVRASDIHAVRARLRAELADSLIPSTAAARTTPPAPREPAARSWAIWLASGALAAIILLAIGVGVKQRMAEPSRALPSMRHTAAGGARGTALAGEEALERTPPAPLAVEAASEALDTPAADAEPESRAAPAELAPAVIPPSERAEPSGAALRRSADESRAGGPAALRPRAAAKRRPDGARLPAALPAPSGHPRRRPSQPSGPGVSVPDNPY